MILTSKNIRCDTSLLRTCGLCYERPLFFSDEDLNGHNDRYHKKKDDTKLLLTQSTTKQLKSLEKSRKTLIVQLEDIQIELQRLNQSGLSRKRTTDIVRKEIKALQDKIGKKNSEIENLKLFLHKNEEEKQPVDYTKPTNHFQSSQRIASLKDVTSDHKFTVETPHPVRSDSIIDAEKIHSKSVECRLSLLESEMKRLKEHTFGKQNEIVKNIHCVQKKEVDLLEKKEEELAKLRESIENLKVLLVEKDRVAESARLLNDKYQQSLELQSLTKKSLEERLVQMTGGQSEMVARNKELSLELQKSISFVRNAEESVSKLTKDHQSMESESASNQAKIKSLLAEIKELKVKSSAVSTEDSKRKLAALQEQLEATKNELVQKTYLLDEHDTKMSECFEQESSLKDEVKCLVAEKARLSNLIKDFEMQLESSKQQEGEIQEKLRVLQTQHDSLVERNAKSTALVEELNTQRKEEQKNMDSHVQQIEQLSKEQENKIRDLKRVRIERDSLKKELNKITNDHDKCRKNEKNMRISYESSIQSMRTQMENLLDEETKLAVKLEKELKDKEIVYQSELAKKEQDISVNKTQIEELQKNLQESIQQLNLSKEQQGKLVDEKTTLQNDIDALQKELNDVARDTSSDDTERIKNLESALAEVEDSKQKSSLLLLKEQEQVESLSQQIEESQSTLTEALQRISDMETYHENIENENGRLNTTFDKERAVFQEEFTKTKENSANIIQGLEKDLRDVQASRKDELEASQSNFEEENSLLKNQISEMESNRDDKEKELNDMLAQSKEKYKELESKCSKEKTDLEQKFADLASDGKEQQSILIKQIDQLTIDMKQANSQTEKEKRLVGKQNEKLVAENENLMLELFEKKELNNWRKDEIQLLKQKLADKEQELKSAKETPKVSTTKTSDVEKEIKASQDKIVELSKSLFQSQQNYNDSVVDYDMMCTNLKDFESDLRRSQKEVLDLQTKLRESEKRNKDIQNKQNTDNKTQFESQRKEFNETKVTLSNRVVEIEKLLKERTEIQQQLEEFNQTSANFKLEEVKLRSQLNENIAQNQDLTEKLFKAEEKLCKLKKSPLVLCQNIETKVNDTSVKQQSHVENEANDDEYETEVTYQTKAEDEEYSFSFNEDSSTSRSASSSSSKSESVSSARSESASIELFNGPAGESTPRESFKELISPKPCCADDEITADDVTDCGDDNVSFSDDDDFHGTKLNRKDNFSAFKDDDDDEEDDVVIPKRNWGENYMKGINECIEEEIGEECDESLASLDSLPSIKDTTANNTRNFTISNEVDSEKKNSADVSSHSSSLKEDSSTISIGIRGDHEVKENKNTTSSEVVVDKKKTAKKGSKKTAKRKKSKESLPASLPPLKGLPPLKTKSSLGALPPLKGTSGIGALVLGAAPGKDAATLVSTKKEVDIPGKLINIVNEDASNIIDRQPSEHVLIPVKSQKSNKGVTDGITDNSDSSSPPTNIILARSKQNRSKQPTILGSMLGDLPPLPGAKSSLVMTIRESVDGALLSDSEDCSFGDDDIDGLLQDLDEFDVKNSKK